MAKETEERRYTPGLIAGLIVAGKAAALAAFLFCAIRFGAFVRSWYFQADLVDQLFNSSEKRLARALLILANFGEEGEPEPLLMKISQKTLAEMVGITRACITFFMSKFRRLGLIDYNDRIEVHRSLLNIVLHERPEIES